MAYGPLVHRVAARTRKKGPSTPYEPPARPKLEDEVRKEAQYLLDRVVRDALDGILRKGTLVVKLGSKTRRYSDGTLPSRYSPSDLGYSFTITYPTEATAHLTGSFKIPDLARKLEDDFPDDDPAQVKEALQGFDVEKYLTDQILGISPQRPGERDLIDRVEDEINERAGDKVETSIEAYSEEEPDGVDLPEYPDIYLEWDAQLDEGKVTKAQLSGDSFQFEVVFNLKIKPKSWAFGDDPRERRRTNLTFY